MMDKYSIFEVFGGEKDFDKHTASYDEVRDCAIDAFGSDDLEKLLRMFISRINGEMIFDLNWFFLVDNENGIILHR